VVKSKKLTPAQRACLDLTAGGGEPVIVTHDNEAGVTLYRCKGRGINPRTVRALIGRGLLVGGGDALFGEAQTYRPAAPEAS
jgi:hypothetical protein